MDISKRKLIKTILGLGAISGAGAYSYLKLTPPLLKTTSNPRLVIVGLGSYGIALANHLRRFVADINIIAIDSSTTYIDRFAQSSELARGIYISETKDKAKMLNLDYQLNKQFTWYDDKVLAIDPETNRLQTQKNGIISYDALVLAPGVSPIKNESLDLNDERVGSFYFDNQTINKTIDKLKKALNSDSKVIFSYPKNETASRSHFYENIILAHLFKTYFQKGNIEISSAENYLHPIKAYDETLGKVFSDFYPTSITKGASFVGVNNQTEEAIFVSTAGSNSKEFGLICFAPEVQAPSFINQNLLLNSRFVAVNPNTLQHKKYANVFALGDVADLEVEKSISSISEQVFTVSNNLINYFNGSPILPSYDGYTVFSFITSKNIGYYWERNYAGLNNDAFYAIKLGSSPTRQQKIAQAVVTKAKYYLALSGFLV